MQNQYSTVVGATSNVCQSCPLESTSAEASGEKTDCVCNSGSTGPDGETCTDCIAGKYKNATGDAACTNCLTGQYSTTVGATSDVCPECPAQSNSAEASGAKTYFTVIVGQLDQMAKHVQTALLANTRMLQVMQHVNTAR